MWIATILLYLLRATLLDPFKTFRLHLDARGDTPKEDMPRLKFSWSVRKPVENWHRHLARRGNLTLQKKSKILNWRLKQHHSPSAHRMRLSMPQLDTQPPLSQLPSSTVTSAVVERLPCGQDEELQLWSPTWTTLTSGGSMDLMLRRTTSRGEIDVVGEGDGDHIERWCAAIVDEGGERCFKWVRWGFFPDVPRRGSFPWEITGIR